ncbi:MAG: hypothetical protein ABR881_18430 [Candidatus Sulfotelmatobacter sp.]|jgi:hypothetical protein
MRILLTAVCLLIAPALNAQKLQDFTGTWRVDPNKVEEKAVPVKNPPGNAPEVPPPPPPEHNYTLQQIRQSGDVLKISGGEAGTTAVYTIDPSGKEVSDAIPDAPGSLRRASTHWTHGELVTEWKMERNGEMFMHGTDVHSITSDGQLIVNRVIESPRHRAEVRLVLQRVH